MAIGARGDLWTMYELIFAPPPSPFVDPDEDAFGQFIAIPLVGEDE